MTMNMKQLMSVLLVVLAVLFSAEMVLGAIVVTTTPGSAVETMPFSYDIDVRDNDTAPDENGIILQFSNLQAVGFTPVGQNFVITQNGEFSWTPGELDQGTRQFSVVITDNDANVANVESNSPYTYTFTINVQDNIAPTLNISEVLFDAVDRGSNISVPVTIRNTGTTGPLTGITAQFINVDSRYQPVIVGTVPATLAPGASAIVQLQLLIHHSEDSGRRSIGSFSVASTEDTETAAVTINPRSYLTIGRIRINEETSGDFSIENVNTVEVRVRNDFTENMENVRVTVRILDVDGDDLEEESEEIEINNGDSEELTVEFDLSDEQLDEDSYLVEIEVEGEDTEHGSTHTALEQETVQVDRENHQVVLNRISLASKNLQCSAKTTLDVVVKNIGKRDEDNVEIRVYSVELGVSESKTGIDLNKFSDSDNDYRTQFTIAPGNDVESGTYPLTVEVLRDGNVDDTEELSLSVSCDAATKTTSTKVGAAAKELAEELQTQLQQRLAEQQRVVTVENSFRNSELYLFLLGALTMLTFIAVIMALGVLLVKKRR